MLIISFQTVFIMVTRSKKLRFTTGARSEKPLDRLEPNKDKDNCLVDQTLPIVLANGALFQWEALEVVLVCKQLHKKCVDLTSPIISWPRLSQVDIQRHFHGPLGFDDAHGPKHFFFRLPKLTIKTQRWVENCFSNQGQKG